jgi:hypothetical protein
LVIIIYNSVLNGNNGCYFVVVPATAQAYVYNDITGDWLGQGMLCSVSTKLEAGAVRVMVDFSSNWRGKQWLFVTERNGIDTRSWSIAGEWEIVEMQADWIKPAMRLQTKPLGIVDSKVKQDSEETHFWNVETKDWGMNGLVFRNGVKQAMGEDYVWTGSGTFRTLAGVPWEADDLVAVVGLR